MNSIPRQTVAVILAAGKGVRMRSRIPKVLHTLLGKPIVSYVIEASQKVEADRTLLVIGHQSELVRQTLGPDYEYVEQTQQLGTGHALMVASKTLRGFRGDILVLAGDTPFLTGQILKKLIKHHKKTGASATIMTAVMDPPPAYGRIIRDASGRVLRIVEERDTTLKEKKITEVNTSHYCFRSEEVLPLLSSLNTDNDQGEYYLTDIIQLLVQQGNPVETLISNDPDILAGINSRLDLSKASNMLREKITRRLMDSGVTIIDPPSVYIEPDVKVGKDTVIHPFTSLTGRTTIGQGCSIGPQTKLLDAKIGENCRIEFSVIEHRKIEKGATIGPFAFISGE